MANFDFLATKDWFYTNSGGFITFNIDVKNDFPRALVIFYKEFEKRSNEILQKHGCAMCHELARYSMPTRANTYLTADDALQKYEQENKALANVAFKPWENRSPEYWIMSKYYHVAEDVIKKGFPLKSATHQRLASIGKWDLLHNLMERKGFSAPSNIIKPEFIKDEANLGDFILWKSQYKANPRTKMYYVRNKASIQKISKEKSLYNYASIVINGWLKASKDLGDVLPSGVKFIKWPYGKSLGWGSASIKRVERGQTLMTIENKFANLNNIFDKDMQQTMYKRRVAMLENDTNKMFKEMIDFWGTIKT